MTNPLMIVGMMLAAGMALGQGVDPKALAEAQKAIKFPREIVGLS
jgi:hypothetical protein